MRRLVLVALVVYCGCNKNAKSKGGLGDASQAAAAAVATFQRAVAKDDEAAMWDFLSAKSKRWLVQGEMQAQVEALRSAPDEALADLAHAVGSTPAGLRKLPADALTRTLMLAEIRKNRAHIVGAKLQRVSMTGSDRALVELAGPDGTINPMVLIQEDAAWRLDAEETKKLKPSPPVPPPAG